MIQGVKMKLFDVTLTISPEMVNWPGNPTIQVERFQKIEEGSDHNQSQLSLGVHSGTHVDAPYHFLKDGKTVDQLNPEVLIGPVLVLQVDESVNRIDAATLKSLGIPDGTKRLLLKTRNSVDWQASKKEFQNDFVAIDLSGANYLVEKGLLLIGIDYLSIAPYKEGKPTHTALLSKEMVIVEGLDLSNIYPGLYQLYCLPLKIKGSDGAPARVFLASE
jgi:arylformamidase